jgi:hypothetical protein
MYRWFDQFQEEEPAAQRPHRRDAKSFPPFSLKETPISIYAIFLDRIESNDRPRSHRQDYQ